MRQLTTEENITLSRPEIKNPLDATPIDNMLKVASRGSSHSLNAYEHATLLLLLAINVLLS